MNSTLRVVVCVERISTHKYTYTHTHIYVHIHTHTHIYVHIHTHTHICTHTHTQLRAPSSPPCVCICVCVWDMCVCMWILWIRDIYTCTCMYVQSCRTIVHINFHVTHTYKSIFLVRPPIYMHINEPCRAYRHTNESCRTYVQINESCRTYVHLHRPCHTGMNEPCPSYVNINQSCRTLRVYECAMSHICHEHTVPCRTYVMHIRYSVCAT